MSMSKIAEKAGVSIATVSRVLNSSRPVQPEVASKVRQAVIELQLPPFVSRRRPRAVERHLTVAIVSLGHPGNWFEVPVMSSVLSELNRIAQEEHINFLIVEMPDPAVMSPSLRRHDIDGAIAFVDHRVSPKELAPLRNHLPLVRVMGGYLTPFHVDHITTDNAAIGTLASDYLLSKNVRQLAFLSTSPGWEIIRLRAQGFLSAAERAGHSIATYIQNHADEPLQSYGSPITALTLEELISKITLPKDGPLGLFISRDEETAEAYHLLRKRNLEPGRDVIIISCDNETTRLSALHPRPASIDLQPRQVARYALQRLIHRLQNREDPSIRILVSPHLTPPTP